MGSDAHYAESELVNAYFRLLILSAVLAGCATPSKPVATVEPPMGRKELDAGLAMYNDGDFNGAIKQLGNAPEIWKASNAVQLEALKTMAFSYCVTGRAPLCKQQFEKALKIDPNFDLAPAEKGHPQWGPVFEKLKKR